MPRTRKILIDLQNKPADCESTPVMQQSSGIAKDFIVSNAARIESMARDIEPRKDSGKLFVVSPEEIY